MPKSTDHFKMLCDMSELNRLFTSTHNLNDFLQKLVEMVSLHTHAAVCSVYLFNENHQTLSIAANHGLNQQQFKDVQLAIGEGIVGKTLKDMVPICCTEASKHPAYRHFPGLEEEGFEAFLSVPINQGALPIGVLVIQRDTKRPFSKDDVSALQAIASQLGALIAHAHTLLTLKKSTEKTTPAIDSHTFTFIKGKTGAHGYAHGFSKVIEHTDVFAHFSVVDPAQALIAPHQFPAFTLRQFDAAVAQTERQLNHFQQIIEEKLSDVASLIFSAHLLMLKDESFVGEMRTHIANGINPAVAILAVGKKFTDIFAGIQNALIQEKKHDVVDLTRRLLGNLLSHNPQTRDVKGHIVIAHDLFPSDILKLSSEQAAGIILTSGGVTSHVAILARSLGLPLVIADRQDLLSLTDDTAIILDAERGNIYINPTQNVVRTFEEQKKAHEAIMRDIVFLSQPTTTADGTRISLLSNINLLSDIAIAKASNTDGIGLYRTEFPFLIRPTFPTEEEQFVIYQKLVTAMRGKPVTFRTLDIGGDKLLSYYTMNEQNPFLGFRSIRFSLQHTDVFVHQLRAILRAGIDTDLRIMFPMISSIDEFIAARTILLSVIDALEEDGIPHNNNPKLGIMVEIPSIISILDEIAREVDFFSIGTNDLIQFMLAVDRTNEKVASFYNPLHPAVLRTLNTIVSIAQRHGRDVSLCGDMAHNARYIPFLIGIGIKQLSVDPLFIPQIKRMLNSITFIDAQQHAQQLLTESSIARTTALTDAFTAG